MSVSSRRYLAIWLPWLPTDRLTRHAPLLADVPLVVVAPIKSALRLTAVNAISARLGLKAGMSLADARAMYPSLHVQDANPAADDRFLFSLADWCERYTPLVGLDSFGGLILDITGCTHLFGGEHALCQDIVLRLSGQGIEAHVSVADTVGAAWALAHYDTRIAVAPKGAVAETLVALPVAALRLDNKTISYLEQAGLKTVGDLLDRPRAPLVARFGNEVVRRLDQAVGTEDEPITPRLPLPLIVAEKRFADPIALESDVLMTVENLARELKLMLERRGEGARLIQLVLFRVDGKVIRIEVGTAAPLRDPVRIRRLFTDRLALFSDEYDPGFGFDAIRLAAGVSENFEARQEGFSTQDQADELSHLIDRLGARFGLDNICRIAPQNTHIPECAFLFTPAHCAPPQVDVLPDGMQSSLVPTRPIRLFMQPELLSDAIAEVPDGPPMRFRWRRVLHDVAAAEGPERIAMEWWRNGSGSRLTRDYFRVQTRQGTRLWLYREGLLGRETLRPAWFMHGVFA
jgi:protein ImuB